MCCCCCCWELGDQKVPAACSSDTIKANIMKLTEYISVLNLCNLNYLWWTYDVGHRHCLLTPAKLEKQT